MIKLHNKIVISSAKKARINFLAFLNKYDNYERYRS